MEKEKENEDIEQDFLNKIKEFPKEEIMDGMTTKAGCSGVLWRPNNYRRQVKIMRLCDSDKNNIVALLKSKGYRYSFSKKKLISWFFSSNITIQVGKDNLTGIWSQDKVGGFKQTYWIEANNIDQIQDRLDVKKKKIKESIDKVLDIVVEFLDLKMISDIIWCRHEDWIKGEEFIDSIPRECIIHDTVFKKVYGEGVEFVGGKGDEPVVKIKNYIKNRALEDRLPEVTRRLDDLARKDALGFLKANVNCINDVIKHKDVVSGMSDFQKREFGVWIFENLGV